MNMMYKRPMVEKRSTAEFFRIRKRPSGPMITPERISPMIPGIFNLEKISGRNKMINKMMENISTEFVNGV
jgi:hypothetical protein